jgi:hypothetical protein
VSILAGVFRHLPEDDRALRERCSRVNCIDHDDKIVPLSHECNDFEEISRRTMYVKTHEWWQTAGHEADLHEAGLDDGSVDPAEETGHSGSNPLSKVPGYEVPKIAAPDPMHTCGNEVGLLTHNVSQPG